MALRAGYYGIKRRILDKILPDYSTPGILSNQELTSKFASDLNGFRIFQIPISGTTGENSDLTVSWDLVTSTSVIYILSTNIKSNYGLREYEPFLQDRTTGSFTVRFNKQGTKDLLASGTDVSIGALVAIRP